jgi:peptidoglycan/LPS O-acetylase OafA/YrhL
LFFIANAGSVVYIAYNHYDLPKATKKLVRRGIELIGVYFLYNGIKFFIFDFATEPFYDRFNFMHFSDLGGIFSFQSFTSPITILFTIGMLLLIAPLLLALAKKSAYPKLAVATVFIALVGVNWFLPHAGGPIFDFLYAEGNVTFPLALWLVPFVLGFLVAQFEFEKLAVEFLALFTALTVLCLIFLPEGENFLRPSWNMYPLDLYYIFLSFAFMYLLILVFKSSETVRFLSKPLAIFRFLGDTTLPIYIYHWIVIDLSLWLFFPDAWIIWFTVPVFVAVYAYSQKELLARYFSGEL